MDARIRAFRIKNVDAEILTGSQDEQVVYFFLQEKIFSLEFGQQKWNVVVAGEFQEKMLDEITLPGARDAAHEHVLREIVEI